MGVREDYGERVRPPGRLVAHLVRWRWLWIGFVVLASCGGYWLATRPVTLATTYCPGWEEKRDPIEEYIGPLLKSVGEQADRELTSDGVSCREFGFCHWRWAVMKQILLEQHGIVWRSPAEMNPHICYD